jgi:predicted RNase H-like nuclease (RuvC/YqgF family)
MTTKPTNAVLTGRTVNVKPSVQPLKTVQVNKDRPDPRGNQGQGQQKALTALKSENAQLKKGMDNMQIMAEVKYLRSNVESLKKSLAGRDLTIAGLQREIAELKAQAEVAQDAANMPTGPGATSPDLAA